MEALETVIHFWRETPFSGPEFALLDAILIAHRRSAMRGNASTVALKLSAGGSGSFEMAIASALLTLGGKHAPIRHIYNLLGYPNLLEIVGRLVEEKKSVPGWGNSFHKKIPDPDWEPVREALLPFTEMSDKLAEVTQFLHAHGKCIYPNAGAYTAAASIILGIPPELSSYLLIYARLPVWADLAFKEM